MKSLLKKVTGFISLSALAVGMMVSSAHAETLKIALAETPSDEMAAFFVALERAKAAGLDYEWTAFADEELAIQSVLSGQMNIGFGTPYAIMQRSKAPVRIVFQLSKLKFFPVTTKKYNTLKDLNGHSPEDILAALLHTLSGRPFGRAFRPLNAQKGVNAGDRMGRSRRTGAFGGEGYKILKTPVASDFSAFFRSVRALAFGWPFDLHAENAFLSPSIAPSDTLY